MSKFASEIVDCILQELSFFREVLTKAAVVFTFPIWIIPYTIYAKYKEGKHEQET